jgi:hypothetical protein
VGVGGLAVGSGGTVSGSVLAEAHPPNNIPRNKKPNGIDIFEVLMTLPPYKLIGNEINSFI